MLLKRYITVNSPLTTFITLVCTSGVLNLYLSGYVFFKRHNFTKIAQLFICNTLLIAIYCFASAFGLMSTALNEIKFWTVIQYVGMAFSPAIGLLFIMQYVGINLNRKMFISLLIIPFISLLSVATNDIHHFHYRVFEIDPNLGAPYVYQEIGIWYIVHGIFTFASMFLAFLLVLSHWKETTKVYRPQLISLMFSQLVPIITAFVYLIGLTPPGFDPVPMVLWISSLLYLWSISSSRLFRIMPITKNTIFNNINDGVMVLDESQRLIEFNEACQRMFPKLNRTMYGMDFVKVWFELSEKNIPFNIDITEGAKEFQLDLTISENLSRTYQLRLSSMQQTNSRNGMLLIFTDITELKNLQKKLEHQAYYDELTQVFNRRAFFQYCTEGFLEAKKDQTAFTVVLMDIDYFKKVNDTYGHAVGDQVLIHVAQTIQNQLKERGLFARYGGEEFVLAFNGLTLLEGEAIANELRSYVASQPLETLGELITITLSCGVAEAITEEEETLYQLLHKADMALYCAKQEGRNRVHVYREPIKPEM